MPIPRRLHLLIVVLIVVIVLPVVIMPTESAVAPVSCASIPESDALARDAQHYAKDFGVDVEEAICRLSLQDEIGSWARSWRRTSVTPLPGCGFSTSPTSG